jgi:dihydrofolate reductase
MGRIIVSENNTLDGGVEDPTGEEGAAGGGWFTRVGPRDREAFGQAALAEALAADAFLMGRRTYGFLASRWPGRTGALADRLNRVPKYVVSATLEEAGWSNTTVLAGNAVTRVAALKQQIAGDIVVPASFRLVRALLEHDLVDEVRITVYPVILGTVGPVFGQLRDRVSLHLLATRTLGEHLTQTAYQVVRRG